MEQALGIVALLFMLGAFLLSVFFFSYHWRLTELGGAGFVSMNRRHRDMALITRKMKKEKVEI